MEKIKEYTFYPKYMERFRCNGVECEDTCCAGWGINIDENTYKRYENTNTKGLKELLKDKVKINDSNNYLSYGKMVIKNNNECSFLNERHLCDIHEAFGEDELCITCYNYPRVFNVVDGIYEKSTLMSCPIAAELALLNSEKMEFIEGEEKIDTDKIEIRRILDTDTRDESIANFFWDIRILSINILQNRRYSFEERLMILKSFYSELDKNSNFEEVIGDFEEGNENNNIKIRDGFRKDFDYNIDRVLAVCKEEFKGKVTNKRLLDVIEKYENGLGVCSYNDLKEVEKKFEEVEVKYYKSFMKDKEYILENYFVNYIFTKLIPYSSFESISDNTKVILGHYNIIKCYIIGILASNEGKISDKVIVKIIQSFSRTLEHNIEANNYISNLI